MHLDGNYFSDDGHRFIPVGANWVPAKAAMQWPTQWDPKAIEADFARMTNLASTPSVSTLFGPGLSLARATTIQKHFARWIF